MVYTATALRKDIYSLLDSVLESGIPLEVERKGKRLKIVPEESTGRLRRLEKHNIIKGDSGDLADVHWDQNWNREQEI